MVSFPAAIRKGAETMIKQLLKSDVAERITSKRPYRGKSVRQQKWYLGFDWMQLEMLQATPPYVPCVDHEKDCQNFNTDLLELPTEMLYEKAEFDDWDEGFATAQV